MREAYRRTRKDGATGIDGVTAADYEKDLEANLDGLLDRIKSGRYFAPPVRRRYIPKADGTKRPLGIPTLEDKVKRGRKRPETIYSSGSRSTARATDKAISGWDCERRRPVFAAASPTWES